MTAQIISGTEVAKQIREEIKQEVAELKAKHNIVPGLATVLIGDDPASRSYVSGKEKAARALDIYSERIDLPESTTEQDLLTLIDRLNHDPKINGILVQLPLPKHINETRVLYAIDPRKDVDGFHPVNLGKLMIGDPDFIPCTPYGIQQLLVRSGIRTDGAEVVVIGRSNLVGKPITNILLQKKEGANSTVTICHTGSKDIKAHTLKADIVIAAAGRPNTVTADMVKDGVVVIDVGVNRIGQTKEGKAILVGDVDFAAIKEKARAITPVPGGVGPMTITMLMKNTVKAARLANGLA
ncbi:MAG: bifunctional 5,10-methylene-tetrahydrofolate dehydrogenase/5,10-methylene-tetrahydrofolate cyclohydrolase [Dehalococcoidales bacterium]|nr:bifunctional 5,10-methylene-tetrahydrofolate dehydrogenase/5,10-methylene-tetrahydrofolate cyclohydrolase [Dehalococcoidales bacterium]